MVWDEAEIVRKRVNSRIVTDATATYRAVGAAIAGIAGGKEAVDEFNDFLQGFSDGDEDE